MSDQNNSAKNEKWGTNETLLQSYRIIFISSQSFLLAFGAILFDSNTPLWLLITIVALTFVVIWGLWFPVVRARGLIVDFYKFNIYVNYPGREVNYVHDKKFRDKVNKEVKLPLHSNWRQTRIKIDILLPIYFTILWFVLILAKLQM